jgi:hypothetical protein
LNIEWVIACRHVEVHDNLATIVGGGIDTVAVPAFPSPITIALAVRLLAVADELDEPHLMMSRVLDPDSTLLGELGGEFTLGGQASRPEWLVGVVMPIIVQFEASKEGTYQLSVTVDDATKEQPLHVVQAAQPA